VGPDLCPLSLEGRAALPAPPTMAKAFGGRRRCLASSVLLSLVTLASSWTNLPECQHTVFEMVNALANIGADISFSMADCSPEGFSILDCCSDIIPIVTAASEFSAVVSKSTEACGDIDNWCAVRVSETFKYVAESSVNIVAAVSDCNASAVIPSPITCAVDLFSLLDSLIYFAIKTDMSLEACNPSRPRGFSSLRPFRGGPSGAFRRLEGVERNVRDLKAMLQKHWSVPNTTDSPPWTGNETLRAATIGMKEQVDVYV